MTMGDRRVLIVDDDADIRALLQATLDIAGGGRWVTEEAVDGREALVKWREQRPDVIVLDQFMPALTGLATAAEILAEDPDQPIVIFTAYPDSELFEQAERIGVRACVSKSDVHRIPDLLTAIAG